MGGGVSTHGFCAVYIIRFILTPLVCADLTLTMETCHYGSKYTLS